MNMVMKLKLFFERFSTLRLFETMTKIKEIKHENGVLLYSHFMQKYFASKIPVSCTVTLQFNGV